MGFTLKIDQSYQAESRDDRTTNARIRDARLQLQETRPATATRIPTFQIALTAAVFILGVSTANLRPGHGGGSTDDYDRTPVGSIAKKPPVPLQKARACDDAAPQHG